MQENDDIRRPYQVALYAAKRGDAHAPPRRATLRPLKHYCEEPLEPPLDPEEPDEPDVPPEEPVEPLVPPGVPEDPMPLDELPREELLPLVPLAPDDWSAPRRSQAVTAMLSAATTSKTFDAFFRGFIILVPFVKN